MFGSLGVPEIIFLFVLALLVFGPKKLPEVGRALGRGLSELRKATTEIRRTINTELIDDEIRQANPRRLVQDSLRDVRRDLDRAVRGDLPATAPRPARLTPPPAADGALSADGVVAGDGAAPVDGAGAAPVDAAPAVQAPAVAASGVVIHEAPSPEDVPAPEPPRAAGGTIARGTPLDEEPDGDRESASPSATAPDEAS